MRNASISVVNLDIIAFTTNVINDNGRCFFLEWEPGQTLSPQSYVFSFTHVNVGLTNSGPKTSFIYVSGAPVTQRGSITLDRVGITLQSPPGSYPVFENSGWGISCAEFDKVKDPAQALIYLSYIIRNSSFTATVPYGLRNTSSFLSTLFAFHENSLVSSSIIVVNVNLSYSHFVPKTIQQNSVFLFAKLVGPANDITLILDSVLIVVETNGDCAIVLLIVLIPGPAATGNTFRLINVNVTITAGQASTQTAIFFLWGGTGAFTCSVERSHVISTGTLATILGQMATQLTVRSTSVNVSTGNSLVSGGPTSLTMFDVQISNSGSGGLVSSKSGSVTLAQCAMSSASSVPFSIGAGVPVLVVCPALSSLNGSSAALWRSMSSNTAIDLTSAMRFDDPRTNVSLSCPTRSRSRSRGSASATLVAPTAVFSAPPFVAVALTVSSVAMATASYTSAGSEGQALAVLSLMSCTDVATKNATGILAYTLSPFKDLGVVPILVGNVGLTAAFAGMQLAGAAVIGRKKGLSLAASFAAVQFPSLAYIVANFLHKGATYAAFHLASTSPPVGVALLALGGIVYVFGVLGLSVHVALRRTEAAHFDQIVTARRHDVPLRWILPRGQWRPESQRRMFGAVIGAMDGAHKLWGLHPMVMLMGVNFIGAFRPSAGLCWLQYLGMAVLPLSSMVVFARRRPHRVPLVTFLHCVTLGCLGAVMVISSIRTVSTWVGWSVLLAAVTVAQSVAMVAKAVHGLWLRQKEQKWRPQYKHKLKARSLDGAEGGEDEDDESAAANAAKEFRDALQRTVQLVRDRKCESEPHDALKTLVDLICAKSAAAAFDASRRRVRAHDEALHFLHDLVN